MATGNSSSQNFLISFVIVERSYSSARDYFMEKNNNCPTAYNKSTSFFRYASENKAFLLIILGFPCSIFQPLLEYMLNNIKSSDDVIFFVEIHKIHKKIVMS